MPAGKLDDHPGARRTLLDAFWPALPNQATRDVLAAQKTVDDFFQHKLDADWLKARLAVEDTDKDQDKRLWPASRSVPRANMYKYQEKKCSNCWFCCGCFKCCCCCGCDCRHRFSDPDEAAEFSDMHDQLREYVRERLYIDDGPLEPCYQRACVRTIQRYVSSALSLVDLGTDVGACVAMFSEVEGVYDDLLVLAIAALACLTLSTVFSSVGTCFFVFCDKPKRIKRDFSPTAYCLPFFGALFCPELLRHMPWRDKRG